MGFMNSLKNFLSPEGDYYEEDDQMDYYEEPVAQTAPETRSRNTSNVVPFQSPGVKKTSKIYVMEPSVYSEAERIADALLKGEAVLINFKRMEPKDAKRIIDFVVGVAYAINGDVQKVRDEIFICSPANFQVQGNFDDEMVETFRHTEF